MVGIIYPEYEKGKEELLKIAREEPMKIAGVKEGSRLLKSAEHKAT
jgi:hypothetical protein